MELTHNQNMLLDVVEMARGSFHTVIIATGRRSGKGFMEVELINRRVEMLKTGKIERYPLLNMATPDIIVFCVARTEWFMPILRERLEYEFGDKITFNGDGFELDDFASDGSPIKIFIAVKSIRGNDRYDNPYAPLMIFDEYAGDDDHDINDVFLPKSSTMKVVFTTDLPTSKVRKDVLMLKVKNSSVNSWIDDE